MTARRSNSLPAVPFLAVLLLVLLAACGPKEQEPASTAKTAEPDTPAQLTLEQLRNARYPLLGADAGAEATLVNGEYVNEAERTRAILGENWIARGDLNGDGKEDVALVIYYDTGGSGNFREFLALTSHEGAPALLGGVFVGDRVKMESFEVESGVLVVEMIIHAQDDAMCCPTLRVRDRYTLQGGEFVRNEREELGRIEP